ncbi:MAG: hypothetical protein AAGF91_05020 [Actinomycetota bacterium]
MLKRVTWFVGGALAGATGANYAKKKVKEKASQVSPAGIAKGVVDKTRSTASFVAEAVREGRSVARQHEDELKAKRDGRFTTLDQHVAPGDQVYVDGVPVESDRVVVMRPK